MQSLMKLPAIFFPESLLGEIKTSENDEKTPLMKAITELHNEMNKDVDPEPESDVVSSKNIDIDTIIGINENQELYVRKF